MPSNKCEVVIKEECTETRDIMIMRPVEGVVKIFDQGEGIKRSMVTIAGEVKGGSCNVYSKNCSGAAKIGVSETIYSGTPYKISTIRCLD